MRVVADSNILVSALWFGGKPAEFVEHGRRGECILFLSEPILAEVADVLSRKAVWNADRISAELSVIRSLAQVIVPDIVIQDCSDPDDNRILETAVFSAADSIVTGDKHLLQMNPYRSIKIKVSEFLGSIASREI